jgi:hypothetical protein
MVRPCSCLARRRRWQGRTEHKEHPHGLHADTLGLVGIDIGKNSFHVVGLHWRGTIVLRQKWSRG